MSGPVSPDEIRAAAETCHELRPGYRDAAVEPFLNTVSRETGARADARLAAQAADIRQWHGNGAGHRGRRYHVLVGSGTGNALPELTGDPESGRVQLPSGNGDATVRPASSWRRAGRAFSLRAANNYKVLVTT